MMNAALGSNILAGPGTWDYNTWTAAGNGTRAARKARLKLLERHNNDCDFFHNKLTPHRGDPIIYIVQNYLKVVNDCDGTRRR